MSGINKFREFIVKVEGGSGCLFQPMSGDYTYVLTAKHVIEGVESINIIRERLINEELVSEKLTIIERPYIHSDDNKDSAIIKIKKVNDLDFLLRIENVFENINDYYLCGYPNKRDSLNDSYRHNNLKAEHNSEHGYIEAEVEKFITHDEVVGQSGGGILRFDSGVFLLAGIQKSMAVEDSNEGLSRIKFMPVSFFDEIINENKESLAKLYPPYISSFTIIIKKTFLLDELIVEKELIKNALHYLAENLCKDFSPEKILEIYNDSFMLDDKSLIHCEYLWVSFLELLVFNQIHSDKKLTLIELSDIHKKNKLFFTRAKPWTGLTEKIFKSDLSKVEKGGYLLVASLEDQKPTMTTIPSKVLVDICKVPTKSMVIHSTVKNPFEDFVIKHIYVIQEHIIKNCESFINANSSNIYEILKENTNGIL